MHDHTARLAGSLVTVDQELEREFEARLVESSTLAFRVAYGVLRHRQDAEDVAQEAFVKAYRQLPRAPRPRALSRVAGAHDLAAGDRSPAERSAAAGTGCTPTRRRPTARVLRRADAGRRLAHETSKRASGPNDLWAAIDALPDKLRVAIVLANIEEHDLGEVARLLDLPEGTVKSRLFLARQRLKELLQ